MRPHAASSCGEVQDCFARVTWNDGTVLVAERKDRLQVMTMEVAAAVENEHLAIQRETVHVWSMCRLDSVMIGRRDPGRG